VTVPDYGRDVTFGYFLIPNAADPLLEMARGIEERGLDWIGIQDHPYQRRFVDTWTLLGAVAAVTTRVGFFPDVANLPLRPPAMMAKAAASLDVLSGGRFELGLGAGGFWDAIAAYGGPRSTNSPTSRSDTDSTPSCSGEKEMINFLVLPRKSCPPCGPR
jgi:alkanesulfonate monooxygenase SsuD/methylene tetrahydromethanopterin reductase-like flavin-dependent oxidoreductase (luciferase family)